MIENGQGSTTGEPRQEWTNVVECRSGSVHEDPWDSRCRLVQNLEPEAQSVPIEKGHVELSHTGPSLTPGPTSHQGYSRIVSPSAAVEISCPDVMAEVEHLQSLGWRIVDVFPADDPHRITVDGHGLRLVVSRGETRHSRLLVPAETPSRSISPHGTEIVFENRHFPVPILRSSRVVSRVSESDAWHVGRAGMHYRDLVPDRQGGAVIASHIRIPTGGPVPDYPHFHEVRFQLIFCHRGWVRLAYESQGEPFVLHAGECVIQPPTIRHRVLESSDDLHVVEVGYPAEHLTIADHDFDFATHPLDPDRTWDGQRFVRFRLDDRVWVESESGSEECDSGVAAATGDLADVRVVNVGSGRSWTLGPVVEGCFVMFFVLDGRALAVVDDRHEVVVEADAVVVPVGSSVQVTGDPSALLLLVVIDTHRDGSSGH